MRMERVSYGQMANVAKHRAAWLAGPSVSRALQGHRFRGHKGSEPLGIMPPSYSLGSSRT